MDTIYDSRRVRNRERRQWLRKRAAWHMAAYTGAVAATAVTQINALSDDIFRIDNTNGFMMPQDMILLAAVGVGGLLNRAYLSSPKILQTNPLYIRPINVGASPPTNAGMAYWGPNFLTLRGQEDLLMYVTNSASTSTQTSGLILATPQLTPIPSGQIYTVYATSTTAAIAYAWTTVSYTLNTALPAGLYSLVGSDVQSTTAIAHRWIIPNQVWRPGFLSSTTLALQTAWLRQFRYLGEMGQFYQYNTPQLQVFCQTTDSAHDIYMDLVKIG